jgi:hypothetical protein
MPDGINFDTSVLMDYVCIQLDTAVRADNRLAGSASESNTTITLIESTDKQCVIGGKVESEFTRLCERHREIYSDLLKWLRNNPNSDIYEYDLTKRDVDYSENDLDHVRYDVQCGWGSDDRRKQLSDFRRLSQDIDTIYEEVIHHHLDEIYQQFSNGGLKRELTDLDLELGHDRDVIVDAVEINSRDGIRLLVATDSDHVNNAAEINECIETAESPALTLRIKRPADL